jgi:(p)ppGpp synthase/HD superfamily hydrolase
MEVIEKEFGKRVANIINGASEPEELRNKNAQESWRERKQHTIDYILNGATTDKLLVSCADKLDNARAIRQDFEIIGDSLWERFNAGKEKQAWYYKSVTKAFLKRSKEVGEPLASMAQELNRTVNAVFG